jgi:hydrogenase maturation protein HypF
LVAQLSRDLPDLTESPFGFPPRYEQACAVLRAGIRVFPTTSAGRLFDTVAALTGFTRSMTFEGQAAMWLEHLARRADEDSTEFPCRFTGSEIDWREILCAVIDARARGVPPERSREHSIAALRARRHDSGGPDSPPFFLPEGRI